MGAARAENLHFQSALVLVDDEQPKFVFVGAHVLVFDFFESRRLTRVVLLRGDAMRLVRLGVTRGRAGSESMRRVMSESGQRLTYTFQFRQCESRSFDSPLSESNLQGGSHATT